MLILIRIYNLSFVTLIAALFFVLASCGGGGGGEQPSDIKSGVFLDSAVQGLKYVIETLTGTTDSNGTFQYREGEIIKFYINDALIGKAVGSPTITPMSFSLLPPSENPPEVINALRLLQTLDVDSNPVNGISLPTIADDLGLDLNMSNEASVQDLVDQIDPGTTLVSTTAALEHFSTTLENLPVEDSGASYVFSHAYSNHNTKINTTMAATAATINGEYHFSATLPSGYNGTKQDTHLNKP